MAFHDYAHALRVNFIFHIRRDLLSEAFLKLEPSGKTVHDACQFGDAIDFSLRNVSDVATTIKGQEMVFAKRIDLNVPHDDHVVAFFGENGITDDVIGVLVVALREELESFLEALGGLRQALALGVFANLREDVFEMVGNGRHGLQFPRGGTGVGGHSPVTAWGEGDGSDFGAVWHAVTFELLVEEASDKKF